MKRTLAYAALLAAFAGCGKVSTDNAAIGGRHSWTRPGVLRLAIQSEPKNLNPLLTSNTIDVFVDRFMFEPLISPNEKGTQVPILAMQVPSVENGGISKDGLTITYHLRNNAKWSDGVPVTSKDVKWSWQAIMNKDNNIISRHAYDDIAAVDTPDAYTAVVHLKEKFAPFVNSFFTDSDQPYPVAPEHALARYPNINEIPFNSAPMVTDGPFKFVRWVHNDHISLVANPDFFMGKPGLTNVEIRVVPDENTTVNLLKTHAVDWIYQASIKTYPELKGAPGIVIDWVDVNGYYTVQINTSHPPLDDVRVRRAIAYAVDKQNLVDTAMYGQEKIATEDIPDWMWAFDPKVRLLPHDLKESKRLLAEAGYSPGPGGVMQRNGQPLSLLMVTENSNITYKQLALQMQDQLRQAGIQVAIKQFPPAQLYAPAGEGGILQLGTFDIVMDGWYAGIDPDDSSQFMCKNFPPGGYNYSRYCNPEMDMAEKMALEHYDRPTRKLAYAKTQALLARDVPQIFIDWLRQAHGLNVDFKGFSPNPVVENWNAWQWSI
ncbi:MAG: peptide ABC transporter substrate-binding protein [Candidatus Eremiobacteraeota bacterium]|nr:peptide ABC transporter substrate-binding protein [Candidatus Eremiobacteraeota bacterium]